ncbi:hypothetical protein C2G38_2198994 [Gigaspora rosea]|uniref:Uncharacterized protein n=1 Tax=Gigaspora rosea TaxID=44941 RepID=A0A397US46_9GLOM|nr:hypothetical protein C2G38_2198994 [Gigaspora rosea]
MAAIPDRRDEYQVLTYHKKINKGEKNPTYMGHTGTTRGLERCYQNNISIAKAENKVKSRPNMDHFDGTDDPKPCDKNGIRTEKNELIGIEVEKRKPTAGCETLRAACETWKTKIKLFKAQINSIRREKESPKRKEVDSKGGKVYGKSLEDTCGVWMLKVEKIRGVKLVKEEEESILNVLPCKVGDEIPAKTEWYDKEHERNTVTNEIANSRVKRWISICEAAKQLKYKEKRRKYIPNGFSDIKNKHVTYEFRAGVDDGKTPLMMLLVGRLFIHNNLGDRGKKLDVKKSYEYNRRRGKKKKPFEIIRDGPKVSCRLVKVG